MRAFLLLLVVLAVALVPVTARAQSNNFPDQGRAYQACMQGMAAVQALPNFNRMRSGYSCDHSVSGSTGRYACQGLTANSAPMYCPPLAGGVVFFTYPIGQQCALRPDAVRTVPGRAIVRTGETVCDNGCRGVQWSNGDGTRTVSFSLDPGPCEQTDECSTAQVNLGWSWNYTRSACVPPADECPANQVVDPMSGECKPSCQAGMRQNALGECVPDGEECPAGSVRGPDGSCTIGDENKCPDGFVRGPDGTCKRDADNDDVPDEEDPDAKPSFSGGDDCKVPPACSGDAIMCGQARIQWRIDCNTRADAKISGGSCGAVPVCSGPNCKDFEYQQLLIQWRATCALERLEDNGLGGGGGNGEDTSTPYDPVTEAGQVADLMAGSGDPNDAFDDSDPPPGVGELDTSGFGYSRSCPNLPVIDVMGTSVDFNVVLPDMCEWFQLAGHIVLIIASLVSVRILAGAGRGF